MRTLQQAISSLPQERQNYIREKTEELILETGLSMLREELDLSQQNLAAALGISQPAVAQIEQRGNEIRLATLKRYIEAMGGKLSLFVEMPTGDRRVFNI